MTIKIKYDTKLFKQDFKRYLIYSHKGALIELLFLFLLFLVSLTLFILNENKIIVFFPKLVGMVTYGTTAPLIGLTIIELVNITLALININKKSKDISQKIETLTFTSRHIEFTWKNSKSCYFWNSYKNAIILKNAIFLIPKKRKGIPIRINEKEVGEGGFKLATYEVRKRFDNIESIKFRALQIQKVNDNYDK